VKEREKEASQVASIPPKHDTHNTTNHNRTKYNTHKSVLVSTAWRARIYQRVKRAAKEGTPTAAPTYDNQFTFVPPQFIELYVDAMPDEVLLTTYDFQFSLCFSVGQSVSRTGKEKFNINQTRN